MKLRSFRTNSI